MATPLDLQPAAQRMARLVEGVPDEALTRPTPCADYLVGDLLDHIVRFLRTFRAAAAKAPIERGGAASVATLPNGWRAQIPHEALAVAEAWGSPDAWSGMTAAGGVDLPGEVAGVVALDELVVHGWDLAVATGQPAGYDGPGLEAVHGMVLHFRANGVEGLFGPEVPMPADFPLLDRILGAAGRDPGWTPRG